MNALKELEIEMNLSMWIFKIFKYYSSKFS